MLMRIAHVARHFYIPTKVVINKYDVNVKNSNDIKKICQDKKIKVLAQLPFPQ
jgi:MinD superfamily P-loop ATPase